MLQKIENLHLKFQKYYIYLILFLALVLRLRNILNRDFWYDEAFTGVTVKANFWEMIRITANDVHPPLYYILLKAFSFFGNYSVLSIRLFSVIFGLFGIWAVYLFTKELFNKRAALFASLITAISPFAIQYSQEGRMYAMLSFFTVMAGYFFIKALKSGECRYYIGWGIFSGLSFLTHYMGVIFMIIFYFAYAFHNFYSERDFSNWKKIARKILPDKKIMLGIGSAAVIFSFWIRVFISHLLYSGLNNMRWVRPASFSDIFTNIQIFIFGSPLGELSAGMPAPNAISHISNSSVLIGITLFFGFLIPYLVKKEKDKAVFLLIFSFGFMLLIYSISLLGDDYFVSRYLIVAAYLIFIMLGVWLSKVNWKLAIFSLAVYAFLLANIVSPNYYKGYGELQKNLDQYKNNDFYVLNSFDYVIAKYYIGGKHLILYNIDWPQYNPYYWAAIGKNFMRTENYDDLKNNPRAIILANIQKDKEKRNDKTFDPAGLPLVAKYDNVTLYKPGN
ncbi:MAG: glycosyltransferase family 39 protein [Patescibacteria group bacterium]